MPTDTKTLYDEDEILPILEIALGESSGPVKTDIRAAIKDRKKALRNTQSTLKPRYASQPEPVRQTFFK